MKKNILLIVFGLLAFSIYSQKSNLDKEAVINNQVEINKTEKSQKKEFVYKIKNPARLIHINLLNLNGTIEILTQSKKEIHLSVKKRYVSSKYDEGLKPLYGRNDNTEGTGFSILETEGTLTLENLDLRYLSEKPIVQVIIPENIPLKILLFRGQRGDLIMNDFSSDLEIKGNESHIKLNGLTGSLVLSSGGEIEVSFKRIESKHSISILSTENKDLNISIPSDSKVSLSLQSELGQILSDFEVIPSEEDTSWEWSTRLLGTINGGGAKLNAQSLMGNIIIKKN